MAKLKVLDLFSGIGGFSLGLERTGGFETVAFCEIDPFCQKVLKKNWPDVPIFNDVRTLNYDGAVDVITGGFPCQDISRAGKGAGLAGKQSGLWADYLRLIKTHEPRFVIIENVGRLRSNGLFEILKNLFEVGYDAEWHCIPAYAVGSPQERDRTWIVAYPVQPRFTGRWASRISGGSAGEEEVGQDGRRESQEADVQFWVEPDVDRVAYGLPDAVDRINKLGNAVLPQIPEIIGHAILQSMKETP
ncbi:MAG: DNA (cytosine-5-)-methyltransferase [Sulfuricellaceae bacterium]